MSERPQSPGSERLEQRDSEPAAGSDRALKNFRYVVGAVNDEALRVWGEIWKELQPGLTPSDLLRPEREPGVPPPNGWPELLERLWLLKHYLDYLNRLCK